MPKKRVSARKILLLGIIISGIGILLMLLRGCESGFSAEEIVRRVGEIVGGVDVREEQKALEETQAWLDGGADALVSSSGEYRLEDGEEEESEIDEESVMDTEILSDAVQILPKNLEERIQAFERMVRIPTCKELGLCGTEKRLILPKLNWWKLRRLRQQGCKVLYILKDTTMVECPEALSVAGSRPERILRVVDFESNEQIGITDVIREHASGNGVKVAILDSGVQADHEELKGSVVLQKNFTQQEDEDIFGHGTHVAGIIVGKGVREVQKTRVTGIAQGADLIVAKVCDDEGWCLEGDVLAGLEWAASQGAEVINVSLGGGSLGSHCDGDSLADAINDVVEQGIVVVAAAGNTGEAVGSPACASRAIAVGAVDSEDERPDWSATGDALDIVAPGVSIVSSHSCHAQNACPDSTYATISGTSMAAAHAAGVAALIIGRNPGISPARVYGILTQSAEDLGPEGFDEEYGFGRLNADAALDISPEDVEYIWPTDIIHTDPLPPREEPLSTQSWASSGTGWLTGWSTRKKITVQSTYVDSNLTNFPLYVKVNADTDIGGAAKSDGTDIRFTQSDGVTLLSYERESYSVTGGSATGHFWVKVPSISSSAGAELYLYYGNPNGSDGEDSTNVWDGNFKGVWHMGDEADTTVVDSTGTNNGTATNSPTFAQVGQVGDAIDLQSGDTDYIDCGSDSSLKIGDALTIGAWLNFDNVTDSQYVINNYDADSKWYMVFLDNSPNEIAFAVDDGVSAPQVGWAASNLDTTSWFHVVGVRDGSDIEMYVNGASRDSNNSAPSGDVTSIKNLIIGLNSDTLNSNIFDGTIDEVRVSSGARTAAWTKFEYYNITESDFELTWQGGGAGSEEVALGSGSYVI
ncbi:DUF2341 domain-containing protein, partial [Patescibacteria group bacterium]|nr:DUF2341 domain-containing protein [Patescibacteria group bacterium]